MVTNINYTIQDYVKNFKFREKLRSFLKNRLEKILLSKKIVTITFLVIFLSPKPHILSELDYLI